MSLKKSKPFPILKYMASTKIKSYSLNYKVGTHHLGELFDYVNSHLTLMESATINYDVIDLKEDNKIKLPNQINKTPEEYLQKFIPPAKNITTQLIGQTCSICLQYYFPNEKYRQLHCQHVFHQHCIDSWLGQQLETLSCPLCRRCQYNDDPPN